MGIARGLRSDTLRLVPPCVRARCLSRLFEGRAIVGKWNLRNEGERVLWCRDEDLGAAADLPRIADSPLGNAERDRSVQEGCRSPANRSILVLEEQKPPQPGRERRGPHDEATKSQA